MAELHMVSSPLTRMYKSQRRLQLPFRRTACGDNATCDMVPPLQQLVSTSPQGCRTFKILCSNQYRLKDRKTIISDAALGIDIATRLQNNQYIVQQVV
jgi:hypothetical protein